MGTSPIIISGVLRRKKLGELFFDVAKFTLTIGFIGKFLAGSMDRTTALAIFFVFLLSLILGWFILPKEEDKE